LVTNIFGRRDVREHHAINPGWLSLEEFLTRHRDEIAF
jgi:hypothetical protein